MSDQTKYYVHNTTKDLDTKLQRTVAPGNPKTRLFLAGGAMQVLRKQPLPITESMLLRLRGELQAHEQVGRCKVTTIRGVRVDLTTLLPVADAPGELPSGGDEDLPLDGVDGEEGSDAEPSGTAPEESAPSLDGGDTPKEEEAPGDSPPLEEKTEEAPVEEPQATEVPGDVPPVEKAPVEASEEAPVEGAVDPAGETPGEIPPAAPAEESPASSGSNKKNKKRR